MSQKKEADVSTPNAAYSVMATAATLPRTLMGGTMAMRAAAKEYLPQEPAESAPAYNNRLGRSFLYNQYKQAVLNLVGRMFRNGMELEDVPALLTEYSKDIDLAGRNLLRFSRDLIEDGMHSGVTYLLVDFPAPDDDEEGEPAAPKSVADEKAAGIRPAWIHIKQENLINWRTEVVNGVETLTRVQIMETVEEGGNIWGSDVVEQVRVLYPGSWEIWRMDGTTKKWEIWKSGITSIDFIPLIPVYTNRTGFMTGSPLLENLAELNLCHWQSSSDQRTLLHTARVPILFGAGFTDETGKVEVGASRLIKNSNENAKLTYVEHTGAAIGAGQTDLDNLERQMSALAMEPLMAKTGERTATESAIDNASASSNLQTIAEGLCDCIQTAFTFTMLWMKQDAKNTGTVELDCDLATPGGDPADLTALQFARTNGDLSREGFLEELKRRGTLSEEFDIDEDAEARAEEGPTLASLSATPKAGEIGAPSAKTEDVKDLKKPGDLPPTKENRSWTQITASSSTPKKYPA